MLFLAGMPSPSSHSPMPLLFGPMFVVPAVVTNLATTATQTTAGGIPRKARDRSRAEEIFFCFNMGDLQENSNTVGWRERWVRLGSFPAKTGDLTAMQLQQVHYC